MKNRDKYPNSKSQLTPEERRQQMIDSVERTLLHSLYDIERQKAAIKKQYQEEMAKIELDYLREKERETKK